MRGSSRIRSYPTVAEGIAQGRHMLIKYTRRDFGYDLKAWHDHLATTKTDSPYSRRKPSVYSKELLAALDSSVRIEAVRIAQSMSLLERIQSEERQQRDATLRAEREWSGKQRPCPKCNTTFKSVQDRGQCPKCGFMFFASHPNNDPDWWRHANSTKRT